MSKAQSDTYELFADGRTTERLAVYVKGTLDDLPMEQIEGILWDRVHRLVAESTYPDGVITEADIHPLIDHLDGGAVVGYELTAAYCQRDN